MASGVVSFWSVQIGDHYVVESTGWKPSVVGADVIEDIIEAVCVMRERSGLPILFDPEEAVTPLSDFPQMPYRGSMILFYGLILYYSTDGHEPDPFVTMLQA